MTGPGSFGLVGQAVLSGVVFEVARPTRDGPWIVNGVPYYREPEAQAVEALRALADRIDTYLETIA